MHNLALIRDHKSHRLARLHRERCRLEPQIEPVMLTPIVRGGATELPPGRSAGEQVASRRMSARAAVRNGSVTSDRNPPGWTGRRIERRLHTFPQAPDASRSCVRGLADSEEPPRLLVLVRGGVASREARLEDVGSVLTRRRERAETTIHGAKRPVDRLPAVTLAIVGAGSACIVAGDKIGLTRVPKTDPSDDWSFDQAGACNARVAVCLPRSGPAIMYAIFVASHAVANAKRAPAMTATMLRRWPPVTVAVDIAQSSLQTPFWEKLGVTAGGSTVLVVMTRVGRAARLTLLGRWAGRARSGRCAQFSPLPRAAQQRAS